MFILARFARLGVAYIPSFNITQSLCLVLQAQRAHIAPASEFQAIQSQCVADHGDGAKGHGDAGNHRA
jgi:hypothetical protein